MNRLSAFQFVHLFSFSILMKFSGKFFIVLTLISALCPNAFADWQKVKSNTLAWLHAVYFVDAKKGWVAGSSGTMLATGDGGKTWLPVNKFTDDTIRDIYFSDADHGWALIEKDVYASGAASPSSILETSDGGNSWKKAVLEGEGKERLVRFFFSKSGVGRVVGEAGTMFELQEKNAVWKKANVPVRYLLLDGVFTDQNKSLIIGGAGAAYFTDDGISWKPAIFTNKALTKLNSVFFVNQNIGWIVGAEGKIFSTNNGGRRWREQNSKTTQNLYDVCFLNTAEGWAIGDEGLILHTMTAGNVWEPDNSNTRHKLERIFYNGEKAWVVGFGGTIMFYAPEKGENYKSAQPPVLQKRSSLN